MAEHYRNKCSLCEGSGHVIEHKLILKYPRGIELPPLKLSGLVESEDEAWALRNELVRSGWEAEVLTGVRDCKCKKNTTDKLDRAELPQTGSEASAVDLAPPPPSRKWMHAPPVSEGGLDSKSRQAGERE